MRKLVWKFQYYVAKLVRTKRIAIVIVLATLFVFSDLIFSGQFIRQESGTSVETEEKEQDDSQDDKDDVEKNNGSSSEDKEEAITQDSNMNESAISNENNPIQAATSDSTPEVNSGTNTTTGNKETESSTTGSATGENTGGTGNSTDNSETENNTDNSGTGDTGNSSGNTDSGSNNNSNNNSSQPTGAKGTKNNPYSIGEKIVITDTIVYNPSRYEDSEEYQFEITVTDYIPMEEALERRGVEYTSSTMLLVATATVKFIGESTEPIYNTPVGLKLLREDMYSASYGGYMYDENRIPLKQIYNGTEYTVGLYSTYNTEDMVWSYMAFSYYTADGRYHIVYIKLE